ncbi:MAG: hypothetical protein GXO70_06095 [Acidobacteria bacterium]|nr:hypothetical protein [Acidobacteriota bacterium]
MAWHWELKENACTGCLQCETECPFDTIKVEEKQHRLSGWRSGLSRDTGKTVFCFSGFVQNLSYFLRQFIQGKGFLDKSNAFVQYPMVGNGIGGIA